MSNSRAHYISDRDFAARIGFLVWGTFGLQFLIVCQIAENLS